MKPPSVLTLIAFLGVGGPANAETSRVRVPISSLPRQDEPIKVEPRNAMLPNGAREGSPVPKTWRVNVEGSMANETGSCTDDRRASVGTSSSNETNTEKIWESEGKVFFERARVKVEDGKVHVISAERVPVVYVSESIWAYRKGPDTVRLVFARDSGMFSRAIFYGCSVDEIAVAAPTGTLTIDSSPEQVDEVIRQVWEMESKGPKRGPWKGTAFTLFATVSKASADAEPMMNVIIKRP
jgi:hypothetical protein